MLLCSFALLVFFFSEKLAQWRSQRLHPILTYQVELGYKVKLALNHVRAEMQTLFETNGEKMTRDGTSTSCRLNTNPIIEFLLVTRIKKTLETRWKSARCGHMLFYLSKPFFVGRFNQPLPWSGSQSSWHFCVHDIVSNPSFSVFTFFVRRSYVTCLLQTKLQGIILPVSWSSQNLYWTTGERRIVVSTKFTWRYKLFTVSMIKYPLKIYFFHLFNELVSIKALSKIF